MITLTVFMVTDINNNITTFHDGYSFFSAEEWPPLEYNDERSPLTLNVYKTINFVNFKSYY